MVTCDKTAFNIQWNKVNTDTKEYAMVSIKVARTYLYARWLCFSVAFFGKKDLTDFYYFWHP